MTNFLIKSGEEFYNSFGKKDILSFNTIIEAKTMKDAIYIFKKGRGSLKNIIIYSIQEVNVLKNNDGSFEVVEYYGEPVIPKKLN